MNVNTASDVKSRVIGITSHAYDQSDCAKGGVDTRVDSWLSWIDEQMSAACADGTRVWCEVDGIVPATYYDVPVESGEAGAGAGGAGVGTTTVRCPKGTAVNVPADPRLVPGSLTGGPPRLRPVLPPIALN